MGFEMPAAARFGKEKGNEQVWRAGALKKRGEGEVDLPEGTEEKKAGAAGEEPYDKFTRDRGGRLEDILPRQ